MTERPTTGGRFHRDPETGKLVAPMQPDLDAADSPPHFMPLETDTPTTPASATPRRPQKRK